VAKNSPLKAGPRYPALLQLLRTAEDLWNGSRLFFEQWDLSPSQFNILNLLSACPAGSSQVELSRQLIMNRSNVTGLIDRLEKRGLLKRSAVPGDRRSYSVSLTREGMELVQQIVPEYYKSAEQVWNDFPVKEIDGLISQLQRISTNVKALNESESHE
jgi:DNA-binding MarR family transcriptional regulator